MTNQSTMNTLQALNILLLFFFTHPLLSLAIDTISVDQLLTGDQTLVSSGGNFSLGFFTPGNSSRHYIGIWYNTDVVTEQTIVWVANRESPISDRNSARFTILNGNLALLNESDDVVWSTGRDSSNSNSTTVIAVLLDNGNLVLRDVSSRSNSSDNLWQSLDYPGNTWLPGGRIAYNKLTRRRQLLTSWKNSEDPAPGLFSLELDPVGRQYIIRWNRTDQYWTSGAWNGHIFSLVPEMRLNYIYNFSYVDNVNESYFTYSLYNPSTISRFIMDVSGQIKQWSWMESTQQWNLFWSQPRQQCEVHAFCGGFGSCNENSLPFCDCLPGFYHRSERDWALGDYSGGCVRETNLMCGSGSGGRRGDRFLERPFVQLPVNPEHVAAGSQTECESACQGNCSCTAYSYSGSGCSIWIRELLSLQQLNEGDPSGGTIHIRLAASSSVFSSTKNNKWLIIGAAVGSVTVLLSLAIVLILICRRRRQAIGTSKAVEGTVVAFSYKDLQNATKNFSVKLGGGGFGSVFKGTLPDSTVVAVKKLESISQGEKQFRSEVSTIGTVQHVNLVRLRGFCSEGSKKLLVYDYMVNGSLDSHLFSQKQSSKVLVWKTRYQIALDIARGLTYLHEKCRDCIIHCDIKPENILLDAELCPKVADFGLAKLVGRDFSRVLTTMRGTRGYLAPEWISGIAISAKADVYSYGMVLLELVSGRRNSEHSENAKIGFFPSEAATVIIDGGDVLSLLDPVLEGDASEDEVAKICKVACWCIQDDEETRPSMGQVVQILEGVMDVNVPPKPRTLQMFAEDQEHIIFFTDSSSTGQSSQARSIVSSASSHSNNTANSSLSHSNNTVKSNTLSNSELVL